MCVHTETSWKMLDQMTFWNQVSRRWEFLRGWFGHLSNQSPGSCLIPEAGARAQRWSYPIRAQEYLLEAVIYAPEAVVPALAPFRLL